MSDAQIFWSADWQTKIDEERAKAEALRRLTELGFEAEKARVLAAYGVEPSAEGLFKHRYGEGLSP